MDTWDSYFRPSSREEALFLIDRYGTRARIIAGGTDLILDLRSADAERPQAVVDITALPGVDRIVEEGDKIVIGAGATHGTIAVDPLVRRHGTSLSEASSVVGGPQVRNVATIGGNLAHALPAADGTTGLLVLETEVLVLGGDGGANGTWRPLHTLFAGAGTNTLDHNQFIGAIRFPKSGDNHGSAFDRIMRPQGVALPMLAAAAAISWDKASGTVDATAIAVGPAGPVPVRAVEAETFLSGKEPSETNLRETIRLVQDNSTFRTSAFRATREYRYEMVPVLLTRVIGRALARAGYGGFPRLGTEEDGDAED